MTMPDAPFNPPVTSSVTNSATSASPGAYIGIDLGGTRIRAGRFTDQLELSQRVETLTLDEEGPDAVIARMIDQARAVWPDDQRVTAVGISAPGPIDLRAGVITAPPNLKGWYNVPLVSMFEEKLGTSVFLGNDANLAALAEAELGAARGTRDSIYITVSTGIGAGFISNGHLITGSRGFGGEGGHIILIADERRVSTLEREAAGPAIARLAGLAMEAGETTLLRDISEGNPDLITAKMVGDAARGGDKLSRRIIERAGNMLGLGIVTFLHIFNPEVVVIGGGVAEGQWELLYPPMLEAVQKNSIDRSYWENLQIRKAELGENVCLFGAGALALRRGT